MDLITAFVIGVGLGFYLCEHGNRKLFAQMQAHIESATKLAERVIFDQDEFGLTDHGRKVQDRLEEEG